MTPLQNYFGILYANERIGDLLLLLVLDIRCQVPVKDPQISLTGHNKPNERNSGEICCFSIIIKNMKIRHNITNIFNAKNIL